MIRWSAGTFGLSRAISCIRPMNRGSLGIDDRLPAGDQAARQRPLRVRPADDVDEPEVAEGQVRVEPVQAQHLGAEHQPVAEPGREAEREVDLEPGLLLERLADRVRLHDPDAVELAAGAEDLEEARELVRRRDQVAGGDHRREEARVVGDLDDLVDRAAEDPGHEVRERRDQLRAGGVGEADLPYVLGCHAVVAPAKAQWVQDRLREHGPNALAGDPLDDLAEDETPGNRVICQQCARLVERLGIADRLGQQLAVLDRVELEHLARERRHAGSVGEHMSDRGLALTVAPVLRDVVRDPVEDAQRAVLVEQMDDHRGHRLRGREHAERGVRRGQHLGQVRGVARAVAAGVTDRPIEDHLAVAAQAELHGRMDAGLVQVAAGGPDPVDRPGGEPDGLRIGLRSNRGDRWEVLRDANTPERIGDEREAWKRRHRPAAYPPSTVRASLSGGCGGAGRRCGSTR